MLVAPGKLVRHALRMELDSCEGTAVIAEAGSKDEALEMAIKLHPDVVVCALAPAQLDPADLARRLVDEAHLSVPVVVLTRHQGAEHVVPALQAGVAGYLSTEMDPRALGLALRAVDSGLAVFSSEAREVFRRTTPPHVGGTPVLGRSVTWTARERQVLGLMTEPLTNKEISLRLGLGLRTVEMHVAHIVTKLGASSRTDAVVRALRLSAALDREEQHHPTVSDSLSVV